MATTADIAPVLIDLTGRCENPGESFAAQGTVDERSYSVGEKEFTIADGISYDVVFTNAGDGILVTGLVRASVEGACDRCLDPASFEVAGEIEEYYLFHEPEDADAYEDGFDLVGEDRVIDLSGAICDAVVMDTPFVVLCKPDCKGLCPTCGANLNHEACDCAARAAEDRARSDENPFAALKNLKLGE